MPSTPDEYHKMYEVEEQLWWYQALHTFVIRAIEKRFGQDQTIHILDAGCGTGGMLMALKKAGYQHIKGIDHSVVAVQLAKERGLTIEEGNISSINLVETFDVIICNDVFCYMTDAETKQALQEFKQILNPKGIVISNNNAFNMLWGTHDIAIASQRRFTWGYFYNILINNNLTPITYTYWSFILSPLVLMTRLFQRLRHFVVPQTIYPSDITLPNNWLNHLFHQVVIFEQRILPFQPFGSSLFWVAQNTTLFPRKNTASF